MIVYIIIAFIIGVIFGFCLSVFLTMNKISYYEDRIQKLKRKTLRFSRKGDD